MARGDRAGGLRAQAHHAHRHRRQPSTTATGNCATTSGPVQRLSQSRAIALDMESATIAANGFRFRVPYGTLLCVSDKPLHGELKLPGMASDFYKHTGGTPPADRHPARWNPCARCRSNESTAGNSAVSKRRRFL